MAIIADALRQVFMPKQAYESLREEDRVWDKLVWPLVVAIVSALSLAVVISSLVSLKIVFPGDDGSRPFCEDRRVQVYPMAMAHGTDSDLFPGAFYLTDNQTADYFWMVIFIPSGVVFFFSVIYLVAGMSVAYYAPVRHGCLKVVENNFCASKRGGVRCLSILNVVFAIVFSLLGLFLGPTLLTLGNHCALPLFWCYEIATWGIVILYSGTAFCLRRKAAAILDEGAGNGSNHGLEMWEAKPVTITSEVEQRVNDGFKRWMGSSLLSSDDENDEF